MVFEEFLVLLLQAISAVPIFILSILYVVPILCQSRFHQSTHLFTLNFAVITFCCCFSWFLNNRLLISDWTAFQTHVCSLILRMGRHLFTLQVPLSLALVSIHRCCAVMAGRRPLFNTRRWIASCIVAQWLLGSLLALPMLLNIRQVRMIVQHTCPLLLSFISASTTNVAIDLYFSMQRRSTIGDHFCL
jgi:hypothetical protein